MRSANPEASSLESILATRGRTLLTGSRRTLSSTNKPTGQRKPGRNAPHEGFKGLPRGLSGEESAYNAGDSGSIPGSGRSPGEGNGNPLQYSCLGNPTVRGAWRAAVNGVAKESDVT